MAASDWDICPKCKDRYDKLSDALKKDVDAAYGKVPAEKYLSLLEELNGRKKFEDLHESETLREDYQIGITDDGLFYVSYKARCTKCDFSHNYRYETRVYTCDVPTVSERAKSRK